MPPRSVCLNVFTSSLGHGLVKKETEVVVKELEEKRGDGAAEERKRHDSLQDGMFHLLYLPLFIFFRLLVVYARDID